MLSRVTTNNLKLFALIKVQWSHFYFMKDATKIFIHSKGEDANMKYIFIILQ